MKEKTLLFLKGLAMGACDVVPGVSGGTVAFISGIYEELLYSLKSFDLTALKLLIALRFANFWRHVNGSFLLVLVAGVATAILSLARAVVYLLENHAVLLWSFFFGLIVASAVVVAKQVSRWRIPYLFVFLAGFVAAFYITSLQTVATAETSHWYIFLCGMVAICAMILPGISGSFILLLMGAYQLIIGTIKDLVDGLLLGGAALLLDSFQIMAAFASGAIVGLLSFSHLLSWLFKKYYDWVLAFLIGFLLGSLNKVWPWKKELEALTEKHSLEENVSPFVFESLTGTAPQVVGAILLAIIGFAIVFGLERWTPKTQNERPSTPENPS